MILVIAAVLLAVPVWAGDEEYKRCPAEASECITKMVEGLSQRGWIGIEWDDKAEDTVLTHVVANSPAEAAGLVKGDILRAFNGVATDEGEEAVWAEAKKSLIPGHTIKLTIDRAGVRKIVPVKLVSLPRHVMAQWVGNHVLDHHVIAETDRDDPEAETSRP